jgi:hypothetical protein
MFVLHLISKVPHFDIWTSSHLVNGKQLRHTFLYIHNNKLMLCVSIMTTLFHFIFDISSKQNHFEILNPSRHNNPPLLIYIYVGSWNALPSALPWVVPRGGVHSQHAGHSQYGGPYSTALLAWTLNFGTDPTLGPYQCCVCLKIFK